jgi:hypothetical protein
LTVRKPARVGVITHITRLTVAETGSQLVSKNFDRRERAGSARVRDQQPIWSVDGPLEAFELAAVDRSLLAEAGRALVELLLEYVLTHTVTAAG